MSKRDRRGKASDIFAKSDFLFAEKTSSFEKAFPTIASFQVRVEEDGRGVERWNHVRHYGRNQVGEYLDCSNPLCYGGGFHLGNMVRTMEYSRTTHEQDTFFCNGYEGSPKGRKRYGPCMNSFNATIDVEYKEDVE